MAQTQMQQNGASDQQAQAVLDKIELELFTADPQELAPFGGATLRWKVKIPASDVSVSLALNGTEVTESGELLVTPQTTTSYVLTANARRRSRQLGQRTIDLDFSSCITKKDSSDVTRAVTTAITEQIKQRTDGVYLRTDTLGIPNPIVTITDGQMNLYLSLGKRVTGPDPTITINASFGIIVVPGLQLASPPVLAAVNKDIHTDVHFPGYEWLVPGALIGLAIATSGGEGDAYRAADSMIDEIVSELLSRWFATPTGMYKQHAAFFVDELGGEFSVTFCPAPQPVFKKPAS